MQRSRRTSYQNRRRLRERVRNELELNARARDITQKYKQYLQKKRIGGKPEKELQGETNGEEQTTETTELSNDSHQSIFGLGNSSDSPVIQVQQYPGTSSGIVETKM